MSVRLLLSCGGCDATATVGPVRKQWVSVFGGDLRKEVTDKLEDHTPEGWVMFDPYTHCTYCRQCWERICA